MNGKTKLACIFIALLLACALVLSSAYIGARLERDKYTGIVAGIVAENERSVAELRSSLAESQGRIESIGAGLGRAIDSASKLADRSARIRALVQGIDEAIRIIKASQ
jgi:hypothetical protein